MRSAARSRRSPRRVQRRHRALLRRQGVGRGRGAIHWAGTIVDRWTEGERGQHRQQRLAQLGLDPAGSEPDTSLLPVTNCPDVVILSAVLADLHWSAIASNDHRLDRMPFELEVSRRPNISRAGFA